MAGNVIGSVMLRPCPTQLFQLHTLGEGEALGQDLWERPFPPEPSVWDSSLLLQPVCAVSSQALVRLTKSGTCSSLDIHGYWCNFCQYSSHDKADFAKHVITHRFSCQFCVFSSFTRSNVILHVITSHAEKEASADLKYCVLRMDVQGEESSEEREPLPVSVQKRFVQSLSLPGEVFKKRKLFSQGEGRLSKVAKRFPSDSPSSLSLPHRGLHDSPSTPRLEIDTAEDAVVRATEESTQARRSSPMVRGIPMSESPRPSSNGSPRGCASPHAARGGQSRSSSQPPSDGNRGFQTLRSLLIQSDDVRRLKMADLASDAANAAARSLGRSSPEDEGLPPASDEEEWMSDCTQGSSGNSSASEEFQYHGSLKSITAKSHHTRYRQRCTTASTSSSSSDHLAQRGRSSSLLQSPAHAVRASRVRSNSLGDEPNGVDRASQQSDRFPLLFQYLTQETIMDEHLKGRARAMQASTKPSDHREIQMEAPILRQCLSQTSQQNSGKHSSPVPQVSSATLPPEVSIKLEPQSEDSIGDAPAASLPVSAPVSGVAVAFAASRGRPSGEILGNGTHGSSHNWEPGRPTAMSGSVEHRGGYPKAQPGHSTVKQEPMDDGYEYSTFIPTHQSRTSLTTSVMPSCASRSREHATSSPQFLRDSPPFHSSQQLRASADTPPPRNTELRRLLAPPPAQNLQAASEKTSGNAPRGDFGHQSSASEHLPSTRNSSLLRSALLQAGSDVQPATKKPSTDSGASEVDMHFSRLLQSLVPAGQSQSVGTPPMKSSLLPQLLRSSQPFSTTPSTASTAPLSTLSASQPMDLSKRAPHALLHSLGAGAGKPMPLKSEPPEEAHATSVVRDDSSSDGMRFLIKNVKSLSDSASCGSGSDEPVCEKKENETTEDNVEDAGSSVHNSAVGSPSDGEPGYREQLANHANDCVPEVLNLTTSDRTSYSSSDSKETVRDGSPAGSDPEDLRQKKASDTATHLSASLSPSSSLAPSTGSTSPSGRPTASSDRPHTDTASSPAGSHSNGQRAKDSSPAPGSSKVAPRREVRQPGLGVDYHSLLQMKVGGMGHYLADSVDSSEHEEVTDEEGKEDYCSGHSSLWTDADKDVRKLTVETEEPGLEEMGEDKRV